MEAAGDDVQVGLEKYCADKFDPGFDIAIKPKLAALKGITLRTQGRGLKRTGQTGRTVFREDPATGSVYGRVENIRIRAEGIEGLGSRFCVVEFQSRGTGVANHLGQRAEISSQVPAISDDLHEKEGGASQYKGDNAGHHDNGGLLGLE